MRNSILKYYWILFVIWPFGSFILAVRNGLNKNAQAIILAFSFLYGYTVFFEGGDIIRYLDSFGYFGQLDWADFFEKIYRLYDAQYIAPVQVTGIEKPDLYAFSLQFLISRISDNPRVFFGFASLIYVYFFLQFISYVSATTSSKSSYDKYLVFLIMLFLVPFFRGVTGIRYFTGFFVFLFFIFKYINSSQRKHILFSFASILIHYSFLFPCTLLLAWSFADAKAVRFLIIFGAVGVFLFVARSTIFEFSSGFIENDTTAISKVGGGYLSYETTVNNESVAGATNWYVRFNYFGLPYFLLIVYPFARLLGLFRISSAPVLKMLRSLSDLSFGLSLVLLNLNFPLFIRLNHIFMFIFLYQILLWISEGGQLPMIVRAFFSFFLILNILVSLRSGLYTVEPALIVDNLMTVFFVFSDVSLSELLIGH